MVEFIPAEGLKQKFSVFGHFYSVEVDQRKSVDCRSVLEILETAHSPQNTSAISGNQPDALFIMMNPGSSRPLVEVNNQIQARSIHDLAISLVPAKPDTTQYQVMRVMHFCKWHHVRILNLSDLRSPKSKDFYKQFISLEQDHNFYAHSIFADQRAAELTLKLPGGIPVIRAWGVSPNLEPLIDRCIARLPRTMTVSGLMKEGTKNKFFHPLPSLQSQQLEWVNLIVKQCLTR